MFFPDPALGNGQASEEELVMAVESPEVAEAVIKAADTEQDGALSVEEEATTSPKLEAMANADIVAEPASEAIALVA